MCKPVQIPGMPDGWMIESIQAWRSSYSVDILTPQGWHFSGEGESFVEAVREALDPDSMDYEAGEDTIDLPPSFPSVDQLVALLHSGGLDEMLQSTSPNHAVTAVLKPVVWPAPRPPERTPKACAPEDVAAIAAYACEHVLSRGYYDQEQRFVDTGQLDDHLYSGHDELENGAFSWTRSSVYFRKNGGGYVWVRLPWADIRRQLQNEGAADQLGLFGTEAA